MLVKLQCPQCGATMEIDNNRERVYCTFCGTKIANLKERIEITQNVNMSGTVRHVMDRSNDPNLYISYATAVPTVVMVVRIVDTGNKSTYLDGQSKTYRLRQGQHEIVLKIGKRNYNRIITIPADNQPVRIYAAYTGRHAEITIDQPQIRVYNSACGDLTQTAQTNPSRIGQSAQSGKGQSPLGIAAFIFSLLMYTAPIGIALAIIDIVQSKKYVYENQSHGLAIAGLIIGAVFSVSLIFYLLTYLIEGKLP